MANYKLVTSTEHRNYRIITEKSYALGDGLMHIMVFPLEFRAIQHHFPIFFAKDPDDGSFYATALFGLEQNENLFLQDDGWGASYVPIMMERSPFFISFQSSQGNKEKPVVSIDMDSPRTVSYTHLTLPTKAKV